MSALDMHMRIVSLQLPSMLIEVGPVKFRDRPD